MTPCYKFWYSVSRYFFKSVFRLKIEGLENLKAFENKKLLLAANHTSLFDPPLVGIACSWDIHFLAKKSLFEKPFLKQLLPRLNVTPVDRDRPEVSALRQVVRLLNNNKTTLIFPEGTRSENGQLQPGRPGIGMIVSKTFAPVIPVRIFGSYEAFPRNSKRIHFEKITVKFGAPLLFTKEELTKRSSQYNDPREIYQAISDDVMAAIKALQKD